MNHLKHLFCNKKNQKTLMLKAEVIKKTYRKSRAFIYGLTHRGNGRECPLCGQNYSRFGPGGLEKRDDAQCMNCGSLERHRFLWLYLQCEIKITQQKNLSVLHFAPEKYLANKLQKFSHQYVTGDLAEKNVDVRTDITNTPFLNNSFDLILCSHVLEHVTDDRKALSELFRIVKDDGKILIIIPVERENTFEDPSVTEPDERLKIFGQRDHVRIYGEDFIDRLIESGFEVNNYLPKDLFSENEQIKYGIKIDSDRLYICSK